MRPLLCIAVLAAIACAASAAPTLTNFVLQAHGQRIRFGFAAPATLWSGSTANATWVPAQNAQCTAGLITVVSDALIVPLSCYLHHYEGALYSATLALDLASGAPIAFRNFTTASLVVAPNALPDGDLLASCGVAAASYGLCALDSQLRTTWSLPLCTQPPSCGVILAVSATGDVILYNSTAGAADIAYPSGAATRLASGEETLGELDAFGKGLFVYNTTAAGVNGFWLAPLPLANGTTDRVWFPYPFAMSDPNLAIRSDLSGNVYSALLRPLTGGQSEWALLSYAASGKLRWQTAVTLGPSPTAVSNPVLTDDESMLLVVTSVPLPRPSQWYLTAYATQTGRAVWNVSSLPWSDLTECGPVIALANYTIALSCDAGAAAAWAFLDQRTGAALPGRVNLPPLADYQSLALDLGNNLYACYAPNNLGPATCVKQPLADCISSHTPCSL